MRELKVNEDFLILLIKENGLTDISFLEIINHFKEESKILCELCDSDKDNVEYILQFLNQSIKPKLPSKSFNYCQILFKAYQSIIANIDDAIIDFSDDYKKILEKENTEELGINEYNSKSEIIELKTKIKNMFIVWFKAFNIEMAYENAKSIPNLILYSHRISGWSNPEFQLTENLKLEIKTNFGYGDSSYFYTILTFKNIKITPFSDWINYRFTNYHEIIRYTKSYKILIPKFDRFRKVLMKKVYINELSWIDAVEFVKESSNLSILNEKLFVEKFIINECEKLVKGLEKFFNNNEFVFFPQTVINLGNNKVKLSDFDLIELRTEKIIGALDFIQDIKDYNSLIPTQKYINKIIQINNKFISQLYESIELQNSELYNAKLKLTKYQEELENVEELYKFYINSKNRPKEYFALLNFIEKMSKCFADMSNVTSYLNCAEEELEICVDRLNYLNIYLEKYLSYFQNIRYSI